MIVQRTFLGGRRWTGPWRIRVDTKAGGTSNLTIKNYMGSKSSSYPILTDWGDGTRTVSKDIASHTLLRMQADTMRKYLDILEIRGKIEKINLAGYTVL